MAKVRNLLIVADLHCGHHAGLTPPQWQMRDTGTKANKWGKLQKEMWDKYTQALKYHGPFDAVICNGDAIDGKGAKSGGTELITSDREEQATMAIRCLEPALGDNTNLLMTHGTPYHVGAEEDWETHIAKHFECKIGEHEWVDVDGVVFDCKHYISASTVATGRHSALNKEALWALLWAQNNRIPSPHVLIRSHVHYHVSCHSPDFDPKLRIITPALQAAGTKFGARRCSGTVDFGFIVFRCLNGVYDWTCERMPLRSERATVVKL